MANTAPARNDPHITTEDHPTLDNTVQKEESAPDLVQCFAEELDELLAEKRSAGEHTGADPERAIFELLLNHALKSCQADYGFVLSPAGRGAYAEQFVKLSAAVERDSDRHFHPCYDTLMNRRPDPMILSVMRLRRGVCGKPTDIGLPICLPGSHPPIRYFLMAPVESGVSRTSVLFVANPDSPLGDDAEDHLSLLEELGKVLARSKQALNGSTGNKVLASAEDNSARHYVQLMSASLNAVVIVDSSGSITAFNPSAENLFGRESIHALGMRFDRYIPQDFLMPILKLANNFDSDATLKDAVPINRRSVTAVCESGNLIHLTTSAYFTRLENKVYTTFVFDNESEVPALSQRGTGHQHYQALTNVAPVGILQLGADWQCEYANEMWCQLSGLSMDETIGEGWVDAIHAEDVVDALVELREALSESRIYSRNLRLQRPTGKVCWVTLSATVTVNEMGQFTGCLLVLLDVTDTHLASEELRFNATHCVMTGLANRSAFLDYLQERLNSPHKRACTSLFYLDLDGFKAINDTLGHDCGDELLRQVAQRLSATVASEDLCARLGGDEFTIIVSSITAHDDIRALAERVVRSFNSTFDVHGNELHLSTSIGIAIADEKTESSDAFIKQADIALYKAKSSGRSRWVIYTREFEQEDLRRTQLHARVRRATERQEFTLVYQPQFRIDDQSIVSFEALLRWAPTDMPVPDTQALVNVLEDSGLINDVGQWVLECACRQFMQWQAMNLVSDVCTMSVNVSPAQLSLANFVSRLQVILQRCNMPADRLNLEITESALIEKNSSCIRVIKQIKQMGVKISLDDFGTGYASLSYLTRFPIDYLKIDKSFVREMDTNEPSRTIVMSVLAMAGTLDIAVVAEGIENDVVMDQLREANCRYGQGFLVSRPLPVEQIEPMLIRRVLHENEHIELV